jgi:ketosteroid isomerase-like protein
MRNKFETNRLGFLVAIMLLMFGISCTNNGGKAAKEKAVRDYYAAYEKKDWSMLTSLLAEGFVFNSPLDDHINLDTYKQRCWPNSANIKKFDVEKLVIDGDDAFVTYNGWTNDGRVFRNTEYFKFQDGKIKENACYFGPGISFPNNTNPPNIPK